MASRAVRERLAHDLGLWLADGLVSKQAHDVLAERYAARELGLANIIKSFGIAGAILAIFGLLALVTAMAESKALGALMLLAAGVSLIAFGINLATDNLGRHTLSSKVLLALGAVMASLGVGVGLNAAGVKDAQCVPVAGILVLPLMVLLAYWFKNTFLMVITLLSFFHWVGSWSAMYGRSTYEFAIQDPRLMSVAALTALVIGLYHEQVLQHEIARFCLAYESLGLVYLNISLLILTIEWHHAKGETKIWIAVWALTAALQILAGARLHSPLFTAFGVTARTLNIYTRYYEEFWSRMHAGMFFLLGGGALLTAGALCELLLLRHRNGQT